MVKGIPLIGTWTSFLLFGGEFPGTDIVGRLYTLHILLLPAILVALLVLHLMLMVINKHTQFAGPGRTNSNVVGYPMMPVYMSKMGGFFFIIFGVIVLMGASLFQINPIWNYGPYDPSPVSAGTQPDWYIGFADGAAAPRARHWEFVFGITPGRWNILVPLARRIGHLHRARAVLPVHRGVGHRRQARAPHRPAPAQRRDAHRDRRRRRHVLRRAVGRGRQRPHRHALPAHDGERSSTACGQALFVGPIIAYFVTKRICIALQKKDQRDRPARLRVGSHRAPPPAAEYIEVHQPLDEYERFKLTSTARRTPAHRGPNASGRIPWQRLRAGISRWFFEDAASSR